MSLDVEIAIDVAWPWPMLDWFAGGLAGRDLNRPSLYVLVTRASVKLRHRHARRRVRDLMLLTNVVLLIPPRWRDVLRQADGRYVRRGGHLANASHA